MPAVICRHTPMVKRNRASPLIKAAPLGLVHPVQNMQNSHLGDTPETIDHYHDARQCDVIEARDRASARTISICVSTSIRVSLGAMLNARAGILAPRRRAFLSCLGPSFAPCERIPQRDEGRSRERFPDRWRGRLRLRPP